MNALFVVQSFYCGVRFFIGGIDERGAEVVKYFVAVGSLSAIAIIQGVGVFPVCTSGDGNEYINCRERNSHR